MNVILSGGKKNKLVLEDKIERYAVGLTNKENPVILFCPYATTNTSKAIKNFHKLMENIKCDIIDLQFEDINRFEELLIKSDILYISGGVSDDLVRIFKENKLDEILLKYMSEKIYVGVSAGAMLFTKCSMGDKDVYYDNFKYYNFKMVDCLNIFNISICPHYQNEDLIIYNDVAKSLDIPAFGIEEGTALVINDNGYHVIKDDRSYSIYRLDKSGLYPLYEGEYYEENGGFRS